MGNFFRLRDRVKKAIIFFAKISTRFSQAEPPRPFKNPINRTSKLRNSIGALLLLLKSYVGDFINGNSGLSYS